MKKKQRLISLGVLAKRLNTTKSKLENYNKFGLIKPLYKMIEGIRCYDEFKTIEQIKIIQRLRSEGVLLKEIKKELEKK